MNAQTNAKVNKTIEGLSFILYWLCPKCKKANHPLYTRCQECGSMKFAIPVEENKK
jgi:hypothetical protein